MNVNIPGHVMVAVPLGVLAEVGRIIGGVAPAPPPPEEVVVDEWTVSRTERLWRESSPGQKCVLLLLASSPGGPVDVHVVNEFLTKYKYGGDNAPSRGIVGGIGRRCKNRYGDLPTPYSLDDSEVTHKRVYTMPRHIAAVVMRLASNDASCNEYLDQVHEHLKNGKAA